MLVQVLNDIDTRRGETSSSSPTSSVVVQADRPLS
jgi:hypothetical protein